MESKHSGSVILLVSQGRLCFQFSPKRCTVVRFCNVGTGWGVKRQLAGNGCSVSIKHLAYLLWKHCSSAKGTFFFRSPRDTGKHFWEQKWPLGGAVSGEKIQKQAKMN